MFKNKLDREKANELVELVKKLQSVHAQISELMASLNSSTLSISSRIEDFAFKEVRLMADGYRKDVEKKESLKDLNIEYYRVERLLISTSSDINKVSAKFDEVLIKFARASKRLSELNNSEAYDWFNLEEYEKAED